MLFQIMSMPFLRTSILHPLERRPDAVVRGRPGLPVVAQTAGEAIAAAAEHFGVRIVPHDPPKWFRIYGMPEYASEQYLLVDIHVERDAQDICIKQDLRFPLLESDVVSIGALAC
jgi:hypothetical protein